MENEATEPVQSDALPISQNFQHPKISGSNKLFYGVILIVFLLSMGFTVHLLFGRAKNQKTQTPQNSVTTKTKSTASSAPPTLTPTPTVIITLEQKIATWSAFSNKNYGYSVKYPPDWKVEKVLQSDPKILDYEVFFPLASTRSGLPITISYTTRTMQEATAGATQLSTIMVASVSATKKISQDSNRDVYTSIIIPVAAKTDTIIIVGKNIYIDILNTMLATFAFIK